MRVNGAIRITGALVLAFAAVSGRAAAQRLAEGVVRGWVRNETGAAVGTAVVTLRDRLTGAEKTIESARWGEFVFNLVAAGAYDVTIEAFGYRPLRVEGVQVRGGETTQLELVLRTTQSAGPGVDVQTFAAGSGNATGRYTARDLERYPWATRDLSGVARLSSIASGSLGNEGLPGSMTPVYVNGVPVNVAHTTAGRVVLPAYPLTAYRQAEFLTTNADLEYSSGASGGLAVQTMAGGSRMGVRTFGEWTTGSEQTGPVRAPVYSGLQAGAVVTGPLVSDTSSFVVGVETWRMERPIGFSPRLDSVAAEVASVAGATYGRSDAGPVRLAITEAVSAFGRIDWRLNDKNTLSASAAVTSLPRSRSLPAMLDRAGSGSEVEGMDAYFSASLATRFSDTFGQELRLAWDRTLRDFDEEDGAATTLFVNDGLAVGMDPTLIGRYSTHALRVREALYFHAGRHAFKTGFSADVLSHDFTFLPQDRTTFWFSSADAFVTGAAYAVQTTGASPASFSLPRYGLFVQDEIAVSPRLRVLVGARWDKDNLPLEDVNPNVDWFLMTGMGDEAAPSRRGRISPRMEIEWHPDAAGRWSIRGAGGVWDAPTDPLLMGELLANDGRTRVHRGYGAFADWPNTGGQPQGLPSLTLLASGFQGARSNRAALEVSHRLTPAIEIMVGGVLRRTEMLPRRVDLNRALEPSGTDQYGRAVYGTLVQYGGMLTPEPGSNRRFAGFDAVSSIGVDGWSEYKALNAAVNARVSDFFTLEARYTYSQTRDNWFMASDAAGASAISPFEGGDGDDWTEGVSDFDIPHRGVIGAELSLPVLGGIRLAGLYRFQSGQPFTPGFRDGVDANGDGSMRNDPAFIDDAIDGFDALATKWDCVRSNVGAFADRNACRAESAAFFDVRLAIGLFGTAFGNVDLTVDALNLVSRGAAVPDRALYLIDPTRSLERTGDVTSVPLILNPNFGSPLVSTTPGRMFRFGLSLKY